MRRAACDLLRELAWMICVFVLPAHPPGGLTEVDSTVPVRAVLDTAPADPRWGFVLSVCLTPMLFTCYTVSETQMAHRTLAGSAGTPPRRLGTLHWERYAIRYHPPPFLWTSPRTEHRRRPNFVFVCSCVCVRGGPRSLESKGGIGSS